jgi:hypothetical protein
MRGVLKELLCVGVAFLAVALCDGCAPQHPSRKAAVPPGNVPEWRVSVPLTTVGTLQPTFAWSPPNESGVSYDFIISVGVDLHHGFWVPGKTVYYRQGLTTTTHTLDQPLSPDTVYVWSVRTRSGNKTSLWAAYTDANPSLFQRGQRRYNIMYAFKTPGH